MIAETGLVLLILALLASLLQAAFLLPVKSLKACLPPCLESAAWLQALCITLAFAMLVTLRLDSDFSVMNVAQHSNLTLPTLYKVVGTWGNHEGSMLLWVMVLAAFGATVALSPMPDEPELKKNIIATQAAISSGFLLFILCTSNPFARLFPPPPDGEALNPLLQDMALAIHPPLLYIGYVGFSIVFSFAVAALLRGELTPRWAALVHPWILASWSALTLGIGLGSWWAYRVLGWGGFWFWDPVENAALLPWLAGTALLHSNIVLKKRHMLKQWVLLLAIVTFALSLLGTFLVRSGVLISVHSFASDPARGAYILGYIVVVVGGALLLYAVRAARITSDGNEGMLPLSREGMIVINNLLLLTACATVFLGTTYPMVSEWLTGDRLTVGPPYFNTTFLPLIALSLVAAGLTPFMPWKKAELRKALRHTLPALWASLAAVAVALAAMRQDIAFSAAGAGLACWLGACSLHWVWKRGWSGGSLPVFLGHFGAAILVAGVTGAALSKLEVERGMAIGETLEIGGYRLTYESEEPLDNPDYSGRKATLVAQDNTGATVTALAPEYRIYTIRQTASSIASIHSTLTHDLYAVIGESTPDGKRTAVRVYLNPLTGLIWLGCVLIAMGGIVGITRRKL
jgi:cytochrome c-type biogenesis protein CcmF